MREPTNCIFMYIQMLAFLMRGKGRLESVNTQEEYGCVSQAMYRKWEIRIKNKTEAQGYEQHKQCALAVIIHMHGPESSTLKVGLLLQPCARVHTHAHTRTRARAHTHTVSKTEKVGMHTLACSHVEPVYWIVCICVFLCCVYLSVCVSAACQSFSMKALTCCGGARGCM